MQGYKDLPILCYTFLLFYTDPEQILMSKRSFWQTFHISLKHKTIIKHFSAVNFNYRGSLSITWINIFLSTESNSEAMLSTTLIIFYWYFETAKQHFTLRSALHRETLNKQVNQKVWATTSSAWNFANILYLNPWCKVPRETLL